MKKISAVCLVFFALTIASASNQPVNHDGQEQKKEVIDVSITELLESPLNFENKNVRIHGTISHICRTHGDKMRVKQDDSDLSIQVRLGDHIGVFNAESEGTKLCATGILKIEIANIAELEAHEDDDHECETTAAALEAMKARGLDPNVRTYIMLAEYNADCDSEHKVESGCVSCNKEH